MDRALDPTGFKNQILFGYNQFLCAESLIDYGRFRIVEFEDLNRLIEAAVLYDEIVFLGDYKLPSGSFSCVFEKENIIRCLSDDELTSILSKPEAHLAFSQYFSNIFGSFNIDSENFNANSFLIRRISPSYSDQIFYKKMFDAVIYSNAEDNFDKKSFIIWLRNNLLQESRRAAFYYIVRALVYSAVADVTGMDYSPDFLRMPIAALCFSYHSTPLPKIFYDALTEKIYSEINSLVILGMPFALFIPPLTANILDSGVTLKDYPNIVIELRNKFAGFRKTYSDFRLLIVDPSVTLKEKIDAKEQLFDKITGIIKNGPKGHALNIRTLWDKLISSSLDDGGPSIKLSLSGAVSLLIEQLAKEKIKGKAKAIFDLWTDSLNIKNYGGLIERAFKTTIDPKELEGHKMYSKAIRRVARTLSPGDMISGGR